jgi:hypothetical protein
MNKIIILIFILSVSFATAYVKVIAVNLPLFSSNHASKLTNVINFEEAKNCILFKSETYNSATYLYFRCS